MRAEKAIIFVESNENSRTLVQQLLQGLRRRGSGNWIAQWHKTERL